MGVGTVITNNGLKLAMHRIFDANPVYTPPNSFEVGVGTATPTFNDTALGSPINIGSNVSQSVVSGYPVYDNTNMVVQSEGIILTTQCNGNNISEFGLVNQDSTPVLFSHCVFNAINKTNAVQLVFIEKDVIQT